MKAGQTNIEVNSIVAITFIKDKNEICLNGTIGEATHPFAFGCTDKGWIGIRTNTMTPFGFRFVLAKGKNSSTKVQPLHNAK